MKNSIVFMSLSLAVWGFAGCSEDENRNNETVEQKNEQSFDKTRMEEDADFVVKASLDGLMEVQLGNIAMLNGAAAGVKEFGKSMVDDHTVAANEVKVLASTKNIVLPEIPDNDRQKNIDDLRNKTNAEFDKDYIDLMVKAHKDAIDMFQREAEKGNDADVKSWAAGKIATLQHHLQVAETIKDELKKK